MDKVPHRNYLQEARENLEAANESLKATRCNAATIDAVHCGIDATDSLTVLMIGVRRAGDRHEDALTLLQTLSPPRDTLRTKSRQLSRLLSVRNASEYEGRLKNEAEAAEAARDAQRYLEWVEGHLHG